MLFKDMDDVQLVEAYWDLRNAIATTGDMARSCRPGSHSTRTLGRQAGKLYRHWDIVNAILRKRGLNVYASTHDSRVGDGYESR